MIFASISVAFIHSSPASASANDFYFKDFTADYYLRRQTNGVSELKVVETLTAVFPDYDQNRGITRVIPFTTAGGTQLTTSSTTNLNIRATRNGEPEKIAKVEAHDGYFEVYVGKASQYVHGEQTYTLTYYFENVITAQSSGGQTWQELYWDTNGNDWSQDFEQVTARVHLDDYARSHFDGRTACYVGYYGENGSHRCTTREIEDGYEFSAQNLDSGENLTYVLGFQADAFSITETPIDLVALSFLIFTLAFLIATIIVIIKARRSITERRRFYKNQPLVAQYIPPTGYTVAEMAAVPLKMVHGEKAGVSTLLELAVTHKIEIIKNEQYGKNPFSTASPWNIRIKSLDLTPDQRDALVLFACRENLEVGQIIEGRSHNGLQDRMLLYTVGKRSTKELKTNLIKKGLFTGQQSKETGAIKPTGPSKVLFWMMVAWWIYATFAVIFVIDYTAEHSYLRQPIPGVPLGVILFFLFFIIIIVLATVYSSCSKYAIRTEKALELAQYLEGLKLYIKMAETDRLKFLQSAKGADTTHEGVVKLYERLLPYAVIFGLEKSWLKELERYYSFDDVDNPSWYVGAAVFSASDFSRTISTGTQVVSSSTYSHSGSSGSSSGGSGFSGGSSGGGGGGGGGGGW